MTHVPSRLWTVAILGLLCAHLLWGLGRVPGKVWGKRLNSIEEYRAASAAGYFLDTRFFQGAEAVAWLQENSPPDCVVLWRGETKGAFELASGVLSPRLLVAAASVKASAEDYRGRPLATGSLPDGRTGVVVLVGRGESVELDVR